MVHIIPGFNPTFSTARTLKFMDRASRHFLVGAHSDYLPLYTNPTLLAVFGQLAPVNLIISLFFSLLFYQLFLI
jgi:hypothetical protein